MTLYTLSAADAAACPQVLEMSWNFISVISLVIGIMAMVTASSVDGDNLKGFGFAAVWSMFLVIFLAMLGQYVLGGSARGCMGAKESEYATPLLTGFWLGTTFMLSIAFFILGCIFAAFEEDEIKTLGAFYLVRRARRCVLSCGAGAARGVPASFWL